MKAPWLLVFKWTAMLLLLESIPPIVGETIPRPGDTQRLSFPALDRVTSRTVETFGGENNLPLLPKPNTPNNGQGAANDGDGDIAPLPKQPFQKKKLIRSNDGQDTNSSGDEGIVPPPKHPSQNQRPRPNSPSNGQGAAGNAGNDGIEAPPKHPNTKLTRPTRPPTQGNGEGPPGQDGGNDKPKTRVYYTTKYTEGGAHNKGGTRNIAAEIKGANGDLIVEKMREWSGNTFEAKFSETNPNLVIVSPVQPVKTMNDAIELNKQAKSLIQSNVKKAESPKHHITGPAAGPSTQGDGEDHSGHDDGDGHSGRPRPKPKPKPNGAGRTRRHFYA